MNKESNEITELENIVEEMIIDHATKNTTDGVMTHFLSSNNLVNWTISNKMNHSNVTLKKSANFDVTYMKTIIEDQENMEEGESNLQDSLDECGRIEGN